MSQEETECYIKPIFTHKGVCYHGLFHGNGDGVIIFHNLADALITAKNSKIKIKNVH